MIRRPEPERRRRSPWPLVLILMGLALGAIAAGIFLFGDVTNGGGGDSGPIHLRADAIYDPPPGDGSEHARKPGVGIVFDAGRSVSPDEIVVRASGTDLRGRIETGSSPTTATRIASQTLPLDGRTTFKIVRGVPARYFMLWITQVIGRAFVYEVKAR